jgi:hypothetical protein
MGRGGLAAAPGTAGGLKRDRHPLPGQVYEHNVKAGAPPVAAPARSDSAATGGRNEALVGLLDATD